LGGAVLGGAAAAGTSSALTTSRPAALRPAPIAKGLHCTRVGNRDELEAPVTAAVLQTTDTAAEAAVAISIGTS